MEQFNNNEQVLTAQPVTTENELGATDETNIGKFKDVNSLLKAYNSLQSEFTRRCQRIKELEGGLEKGQENSPVAEQSGNVAKLNQGISDEEKNKIIGDYLKNLIMAKQSALIIDEQGVPVKMPIPKPKTIKEAGKLAREKLNKKIKE